MLAPGHPDRRRGRGDHPVCSAELLQSLIFLSRDPAAHKTRSRVRTLGNHSYGCLQTKSGPSTESLPVSALGHQPKAIWAPAKSQPWKRRKNNSEGVLRREEDPRPQNQPCPPCQEVTAPPPPSAPRPHRQEGLKTIPKSPESTTDDVARNLRWRCPH